MDAAALQRIIDEATDDSERVYGVFDESRVPQLDITPVPGVTDLRLAVSPDCSFRLVRDALVTANSTLDVYIYNASADYLLQLLRDARDRGVTIRVMYDVMDTRGNERAKLAALGVQVKEAPSSGGRKVFTVCHQKFVVVDGASVVLGSANWATTSIPNVVVPGKFKKGNREWLVHVRHGGVARFFHTLFEADWNIPEMERPSGLAPALPLSEPSPLEMRAAAVSVPDDVLDVEAPQLAAGVVVLPVLSPDNYFATVCNRIREAAGSIDIEQQYIVAGGSRTQALLQALSDARDRGVQIRIIVSPAFEENWRKTVDTLSAAGLLENLRALNLNSFTHLHNKGVLIDGRYTLVTSTNMSENSITQAREAGLLIDSPVVAAYYRRAVDVDWNSGLDPNDVPSHLARIAADQARVDEPSVAIHPADARLI
jgi:cardiolipin synthase A/B